MDEKQIKGAFFAVAQQNAMLCYNQLLGIVKDKGAARNGAVVFIWMVMAKLEGTTLDDLSQESRALGFQLLDEMLEWFYGDPNKGAN